MLHPNRLHTHAACHHHHHHHHHVLLRQFPSPPTCQPPRSSSSVSASATVWPALGRWEAASTEMARSRARPCRLPPSVLCRPWSPTLPTAASCCAWLGQVWGNLGWSCVHACTACTSLCAQRMCGGLLERGARQRQPAWASTGPHAPRSSPGGPAVIWLGTCYTGPVAPSFPVWIALGRGWTMLRSTGAICCRPHSTRCLP
mmetsp:Transcript_30083/g.78054  ORF Transcript_30083/g.78054 Transcript_30083/m.78054 type:complete len:201 (+) Transcript_30083:874-1476(+)